MQVPVVGVEVPGEQEVQDHPGKKGADNLPNQVERAECQLGKDPSVLSGVTWLPERPCFLPLLARK